MLKSLHIENIAVIEKCDIDFSKGFNVLTGETGAGKSIIIDSINAVLGERTSRDLIRFGCEKAEVTALFCDITDEGKQIIEDNGYTVDSEGYLLIMRTLSLTGNSTVKINGKAATVGTLKAIAKALVNIHGQHDSQNLLDPDNHCGYLDMLADTSQDIENYYQEFKHLNAVRKQLEAVEDDRDSALQKIDLLKYEINEIASAEIKVGEVKDLKERIKIAREKEKIESVISLANNLVSGFDDTDGALLMVKAAAKHISSLKNDRFTQLSQKLSVVAEELGDCAFELRDFLANDEFSQLDVETLHSRLDLLERLMLKYGNSEQAVLDYLENCENELQKINFSDKQIEQLSNELDLSTERLIELAEIVSNKRISAAQKFSDKVTDTLQYLDMPNVKFDVNVQKGRYTKCGCDTVEFFVRTNLGEESKPLHKIASGGELSRIMLSIKGVLAKKDAVGTLIFDEIDTGISGRAAGKVGDRLKSVSLDRQVICVTHLAQIAAFADNHLYIEKLIANDRTFTDVKLLSYDERIQEIGRIMSGTEITNNLYNSAKELLDRSQK